ncbi:DUF5710 domain-containing protein [Xenorhabdus szentirmaii]|uniref:DUF5710 domain-containing protein n=1 Tax=Xenorhabdus szentirmaii TaxID=290112 RepID=UPI002B4092B9|nr:DUF5710 domain-containing protein [Xenorhabdus sp. M]
MLRIDLNVPDDEYEKARKLGAHWDAVAQIWYIDNSFDPTPFMHWLPFYNVHAECWYLAQTQTACPHCHELTTVTRFCCRPDTSCWKRLTAMSPARKLITPSRTARRFCFTSPIFPRSCVVCCPAFITVFAKLSASGYTGSTG